jgi:transposase-like protein
MPFMTELPPYKDQDELAINDAKGRSSGLGGPWIRTGSCSMSSRNTGAMPRAAKRLMRKLLRGQGRAPRVMITDKLRSYGAAKRSIMPDVKHRSLKGLNNRAENSHQPIRRRERIMKRFKSPDQLQRCFPPMIRSPTSSTFPATTFRPAVIAS